MVSDWKNLKDHPVPPPCPGQGQLWLDQDAQSSIHRTLNTSRDRESTISWRKMPWEGLITVDIEALAVEAVVSQLGDAISHFAQLMVNSCSVEFGIWRPIPAAAHGIYSCVIPVLCGPRKWGIGLIIIEISILTSSIQSKRGIRKTPQTLLPRMKIPRDELNAEKWKI